MYRPLSTYRVQLHKDFKLSHLEAIIPYLASIGVHTLYASPVFHAVPGSTHGYDGLNPLRINPEIGTEADLRRCAALLKEHGMGWLQDIVPNHMAFHVDNPWLRDVLIKGQDSPYASFFDIDWNSEGADGKLMAPFLGAPLEEEIMSGNLQLDYRDGAPVLQYYDTSYPLNATTHNKLLSRFSQLSLPSLEDVIKDLNKDKALLYEIASQQYYQLCPWQDTDQRINYRRFFTINGLICLNIQDPHVFNTYHAYILQLLSEGVFQGLRIDHIDGLYDPAGYIARLREAAGDDAYIVAEKILQPTETMPADWPIEGSTGYDFLAMANNLLTNKANEEAFTRFYHSFTGDDMPLPEQVLRKKSAILYDHMGGELDNLYRLFLGFAPAAWKVHPDAMKSAIGALLIYCPVYRYYDAHMPLPDDAAARLEHIINTAKARQPELAEPLAILHDALITKPAKGDKTYNEKVAHFYRRCMQFSGPLMAKGVEDTLMYTYARYIGHNEVGDTPEAFGISVADFHRLMLRRQKDTPLAMNATATHDTKRGEDARARLAVLTDMSGEWTALVQAWYKEHVTDKEAVAPDTIDEYFLYQAILASHPMPGMDDDDFSARFDAFIEKMLREAKRHSGWAAPNTHYESATKSFAQKLLQPDSIFQKTFAPFLQRVAQFGIINSLAQTILKATCPGVPDFYQGTELWDLSLVDPDNRRAVDYGKRQVVSDDLSALWQHRFDGRIKAALIRRLLQLRRQHLKVFTDGQYIPLKVEGTHSQHVFAFARRHGRTWIVIALPLHLPSLCNRQPDSIATIDWGDTHITLPPYASSGISDVLTPQKIDAKELRIADLFRELPFAILRLDAPANKRGAGILLAVSSLPSAFGIGDLGPEAHTFVRFLSRARQRYWQMLPLTPTEPSAGHSPYSSYSAFAGNPWLISPEGLMEDGLLIAEELDSTRLPASNHADYDSAMRVKQSLFDAAFQRFQEGDNAALTSTFRSFCTREAVWMDDVALFIVLRKHFVGEPWHRWPEPYRNRDADTLAQFADAHTADITKYKWLQFNFNRQWQSLRSFAASAGISLFGDIPFYVGHDSADVWANRSIFSLDAEGRMTGVAGVPPDYFSEDGQLWGMPTFNWDALKKDDYAWWLARLRRNLELFDLLRIDHFRAFQDYWEVPVGETTAKNGQWLPGPRSDFFEAMTRQLGDLPFVAEDLGDKMEDVYTLRNRLRMPGMKVLQFAWGDNMPQSVDAPHHHQINSIVYTGTHDNNTTIGWYSEDAARADHERLHRYIGLRPRIDNIHEVLARLAYASVARLAILPMQDVLGLPASARMNTPGQPTGNWTWRLLPGQAAQQLADKLRDWVELFDRG